MAEVRLRDVSKRFGDVIAVQSIRLDVADGQFLVLVGPSGCGKTTTLRMVAGLEVPSSGQVYIGERDVTYLHPRERNIAMVFQDYALYPHMTVEENLSFGLRNLKYPGAEIRQRVQEAATILQIGHLLRRKPRQLSGGERQRVALGRAITRRPEVFLFDEPLSNLDARLRTAMRLELAELHARLRATAMYVTHDQVEAMTLGERIVVMNRGEVQQIGTAHELYNQPVNLFVAEFIGSPPMNLFRTRLLGETGSYAIALGVLRLPLTDRQATDLLPFGEQLVCGLRPDAIHLPGASPNGNLRATVTPRVIEMFGPAKVIYFELGDELLKASLSPELSCRIGESLELEFDVARAHFFDRDTGRRL